MTSSLIDLNGNPLFYKPAHRAASTTAKEFSSWNPSLTSGSSELVDERERLVARHRDLERNDGVISGVSQTYKDNILGPYIKLSAKPDYNMLGKDKEWANDWSKHVEAEWRAYADTTEIDASRSSHFHGLSEQVLTSVFQAGETAALPLWLEDRKTKTAFQMIDTDRISTPPGLQNNPMVRDGIRINSYGEPVSAFVRKTHPADDYKWATNNVEYEEIKFHNKWGRKTFIHAATGTRIGQYRGKPASTAIMSALKMLNSYQEYELKSVITTSLIAAFIETQMSGEELASVFGSDASAFDDARKQWDANLEGGSIIQLPPGDKLSPFTPSRPTTSYAYYVDSFYRHISAGFNIPYELVMKDFSKTNYSSARAAMLEAWRFFSGRRKWLTDYWYSVVYSLWMEEKVNDGTIEAPDFYSNKFAYTRAKWIGAGRGWVDPVKEINAAERRIMVGISTLEDECAEQGKDWEEVLEQRAREKAKMAELGISDMIGEQPPLPVENSDVLQGEDDDEDEDKEAQETGELDDDE